MLSQSLILVVLTGLTFATPQPQDAGSDTSILDISDDIYTGIYSDMPSLPASIYDILETAIPNDATATMTDGYSCNPTTEAFFGSLPADVQSALVSYNSGLLSWAFAHSSELGEGFPTDILKCGSTTANSKDTATPTGSDTAEATGFVTTVGGVVETGSSSLAGGASVTKSSTITSGASVSGTGTAAGASVTSTRSQAAAPIATGAIVGSFAGIVGALGVMAML